MTKTFEFEVCGKYALFSDPITKMGGEKCSYCVPTYSAIKGVLDSIFWKPTFTWVVEKIRVMNRIEFYSKTMKPLIDWGSDANSLAIYTYIANPVYQVTAHYEWDLNRPDLAQDRNYEKHNNMIERWIERGGSKDVFLGTRECCANVRPCETSIGHYDSIDEVPLGIMFHSFEYPNKTKPNGCNARFQRVAMNNGFVQFLHPDECTIKRFVKDMHYGDKR